MDGRRRNPTPHPQQVAGHKEITTTQPCFHPDIRELAKAGEALTRHLVEQLRLNGQIPRRW
ncbi:MULTISPECIES: hypothetical protein [Streptomyces]|uniref:hypothetical protein n=1 Tax=Streptomyces TaxID=1883 RepID=UPI000A8474DB|nr:MULTISPECIES: hypothetical protein [Streptomyces]